MIFSKIVVPLRGKTARRQAAFGKNQIIIWFFRSFALPLRPKRTIHNILLR